MPVVPVFKSPFNDMPMFMLVMSFPTSMAQFPAFIPLLTLMAIPPYVALTSVFITTPLYRVFIPDALIPTYPSTVKLAKIPILVLYREPQTGLLDSP